MKPMHLAGIITAAAIRELPSRSSVRRIPSYNEPPQSIGDMFEQRRAAHEKRERKQAHRAKHRTD